MRLKKDLSKRNDEVKREKERHRAIEQEMLTVCQELGMCYTVSIQDRIAVMIWLLSNADIISPMNWYLIDLPILADDFVLDG